MTDEVSGAIPIETPVGFDPSQLILGQRPFSEMTDAELIAGIAQLREARDPLQQGATRRALGVRDPKAPKGRAQTTSTTTRTTRSTSKSLDATSADFLKSLFAEGDDDAE